jgi:hypothetical protein
LKDPSVLAASTPKKVIDAGSPFVQFINGKGAVFGYTFSLCDNWYSVKGVPYTNIID